MKTFKVTYKEVLHHEFYVEAETEEEAYANMEIAAKKEYDIDVSENEWDTELYVDTEAGEITIINYFGTNKDVTEFFTFEI